MRVLQIALMSFLVTACGQELSTQAKNGEGTPVPRDELAGLPLKTTEAQDPVAKPKEYHYWLQLVGFQFQDKSKFNDETTAEIRVRLRTEKGQDVLLPKERTDFNPFDTSYNKTGYVRTDTYWSMTVGKHYTRFNLPYFPVAPAAVAAGEITFGLHIDEKSWGWTLIDRTSINNTIAKFTDPNRFRDRNYYFHTVSFPEKQYSMTFRVIRGEEETYQAAADRANRHFQYVVDLLETTQRYSDQNLKSISGLPPGYEFKIFTDGVYAQLPIDGRESGEDIPLVERVMVEQGSPAVAADHPPLPFRPQNRDNSHVYSDVHQVPYGKWKNLAALHGTKDERGRIYHQPVIRAKTSHFDRRLQKEINDSEFFADSQGFALLFSVSEVTDLSAFETVPLREKVHRTREVAAVSVFLHNLAYREWGKPLFVGVEQEGRRYGTEFGFSFTKLIPPRLVHRGLAGSALEVLSTFSQRQDLFNE